jgi:lysophospholipase L1-like esterase
MPADKAMRKALQIGRAQAREVLKFRSRALRKRAAALKAKPQRLRSQRTVEVDPALLRAVGAAQTAGVLVAEGDSWFDYPLNDVLRMLEDHHAYEVESVAQKGDRVEEMAYGMGQLEELTRTLEKLLRQSVIPKAILLSGGGNDVAGDEFGMLLDHAQSPLPGFNDQIVSGIIDQRVKIAYVTILSAVTEICEQRLNRKLPILVHGYDYPVPDGRGFAGGGWFLPGPWLEPGFREKGFDKMAERIRLMKQLIDRFNSMLKDIAAMTEFPHVTYINLRNTLSTRVNYKQYWANELHPTARGFELVTDRFVAVLDKLPAN